MEGDDGKPSVGLVKLTPDIMEQIGQTLDEREADIKARYPKLVAECPAETKLAVVAWVFERLIEHAQEGGTFRYLIYNQMGFGPEAYLPLYLAGGMTISNALDLEAEKQAQEKLSNGSV